MKCACINPNCPSEVSVSGIEMTIRHNKLLDDVGEPKEMLIYLDANGIVELMTQLRESLSYIAEGKS